jgi:hypothetical protein
MIKFNFCLHNFINLFKLNIINLNSVDIVIFSIFINLYYFNFLPEMLKVFIAIFIVRKALMTYTYTQFLENIFFVSGVKIKKLVLINFYFNNIIFLVIAVFLLLFKLSILSAVVKNLFILNALISISFILRFVIPFQEIKQPLFRNSIRVFLYYIFFGFLGIGLSYPLIGTAVILVFFFLLIYYFNRTLCYDDFR